MENSPFLAGKVWFLADVIVPQMLNDTHETWAGHFVARKSKIQTLFLLIWPEKPAKSLQVMLKMDAFLLDPTVVVSFTSLKDVKIDPDAMDELEWFDTITLCVKDTAHHN